MSTLTRTTWLSALAVLLTCTSLAPVFDDSGWVLPVAAAVVVVALAGLLSRRLRVPALLQPLLGVLAVGLLASVLSAAETLTGGLLPGRTTVAALGTRLGEGLLDVEQLSPPVPSTPGLVLLTLLGVGAVAIVADLLAVGLRRPALAGLPLLTLLVVPAATLDGGVGIVPFALGAVGWLGLLMADSGERVSHWGSALRSASPTRGAVRSDETSLGRVGRRIGVAALGTALVVPALVPGLESSLVDGNGGNGLGGSRTTTTYNPLTELGGQLRLPDPQPLLRYGTTDPDPDYLRLTTLDVFDDEAGWSSSELSADVEDDAVGNGIPVPAGQTSADVQDFAVRIAVQQLDGPWLPVPPVPSDVEVDGRWLWDDESQTVFSTRTSLQEVEDAYRVTAQRVLPSVERLRRGGVRPAEVDALAVPPEVSPYVRELSEQVVAEAGATTPYEKAGALQAFFRDGNGFRYSEEAGASGPGALERFLQERRGFCEQYASAMAAMARVLGLPARVAVGFTPGTEQSDGTYQVTTSDAHAWPEIWFAGHGWLRFEPTPRTDQVVTPAYTVPPAPGTEPETDAATPTQAPAVPVDPQDPTSAAERERQLAEGDTAVAAADEESSGASLLRVALVALAVAVVLAVPAAVAAARRRHRWATPSPDAAWAQVREDAVDVGHAARPSESPRAYAVRLVEDRSLADEPASALQRLAAAVERARYARPDGEAAQVDAAALHADVVAVRAGLQATAGTRARWTARLAPPSTLRWMVTASGTAVADGLDRVDELVSGLGARARRLAGRRTRSV